MNFLSLYNNKTILINVTTYNSYKYKSKLFEKNDDELCDIDIYNIIKIYY